MTMEKVITETVADYVLRRAHDGQLASPTEALKFVGERFPNIPEDELYGGVAEGFHRAGEVLASQAEALSAYRRARQR